MNTSEEAIKKFADQNGGRRRRKPSSPLWLCVSAPILALLIGLTARLSYEAFQWGWSLLGWA